MRDYRMIAAGLRANAHLALGDLDAAAAALERRRAVAIDRFVASRIDEHLRGLALVEACLADLARDRHDVAGANRCLKGGSRSTPRSWPAVIWNRPMV
ncbi:MAG: hypothetical protein LC659_10935 [Myxococcales bacterium]|nr:hypothetical protein [Myxococcales bacterium]